MRNLLWAECQKLRRSKIAWLALFAAVMVAAVVFAAGLAVHDGPDVQYGLKRVWSGTRYIDNAGWYMDEAQPWAGMFVLPAVVALLGGYMVSREKDEDTHKALRLIPVDEMRLTGAKMLVALAFSILLYLLLFAVTCLAETALHGPALTAGLVLSALKEYTLGGVGAFLAVSPIIALTPRMEKGCWPALVFAEAYSAAGLFAGMSQALQVVYPITAVFNFCGYHIVSAEKRALSTGVLLLCGCLAALTLAWPKGRKDI